MRSGSGGVPTRQRGAPKRPAVLGWVAAVFGRFLQFAVEPIFVATKLRKRRHLPDWIRVVRPEKDIRREDFNGIRCQGVADAIRTCSGLLMRDRLVSAIADAKRRGLIDYKEAQELEKELAQ